MAQPVRLGGFSDVFVPVVYTLWRDTNACPYFRLLLVQELGLTEDADQGLVESAKELVKDDYVKSFWSK